MLGQHNVSFGSMAEATFRLFDCVRSFAISERHCRCSRSGANALLSLESLMQVAVAILQWSLVPYRSRVAGAGGPSTKLLRSPGRRGPLTCNGVWSWLESKRSGTATAGEWCTPETRESTGVYADPTEVLC